MDILTDDDFKPFKKAIDNQLFNKKSIMDAKEIAKQHLINVTSNPEYVPVIEDARNMLANSIEQYAASKLSEQKEQIIQAIEERFNKATEEFNHKEEGTLGQASCYGEISALGNLMNLIGKME